MGLFWILDFLRTHVIRAHIKAKVDFGSLLESEQNLKKSKTYINKNVKIESLVESKQNLQLDNKPSLKDGWNSKQKCNICNNRIMRKHSLDKHRKKVHGHVSTQDILPCDLCFDWFPDKSTLSEHMTFHNVEKDSKSKAKTKSGPFLYCAICDFTCLSKGFVKSRYMKKLKSGQKVQRGNIVMKDHMKNHDKEHMDQYMCSQCGTAYFSQKQLTKHMDSIHNRLLFRCDQCLVEFKMLNSLNGHILGKHKGEFNFKCDECNKKFALKTSLANHSLKMHPKSKIDKVVCTECGSALTSNYKMKVHMQTHSSSPTFHCTWEGCSKAFKLAGYLKTHRRIHTNEKPLKCDHCEQAFRKPSPRSRHNKIHTGEKPHVCDKCGKGFIQRGNMVNHSDGCKEVAVPN